jgi:hypothetical protein
VTLAVSVVVPDVRIDLPGHLQDRQFVHRDDIVDRLSTCATVAQADRVVDWIAAAPGHARATAMLDTFARSPGTTG